MGFNNLKYKFEVGDEIYTKEYDLTRRITKINYFTGEYSTYIPFGSEKLEGDFGKNYIENNYVLKLKSILKKL
jgi:hypothetical protein